jgi:hypothetical protein
MRYQQVYDAAQFSQAPTNRVITAIRFRSDSPSGHPFGGTLPNIQINLSTTAKSADSLSTNFSDNIGSNDTIVFGPGPLTMQVSFSPMGSPQGFNIQIPLATPFLYDPTAGNLLLDAKNHQGYLCLAPGDCPPPLDASVVTNDSVSRIYAESVNADSAPVVDTYGLITQFEVFPIPQLAVTQTTNALVVTWPTQPTVFVFQGATNLTAANWKTITNGITGNFTFQTLTLPRDSLASVEFFRLVWPSGPSGGN